MSAGIQRPEEEAESPGAGVTGAVSRQPGVLGTVRSSRRTASTLAHWVPTFKCICLCVHVCHIREENFWESVPSLHHAGPIAC